jgi:hypothetical protein
MLSRISVNGKFRVRDKARESLFFTLKKYKKKSLFHDKNECSLAKQMRKLN